MVEADGVGCDGGYADGCGGLWLDGGMVGMKRKQEYTFADGLLIGCVAGGALAAAVITAIGWMVTGWH